MPLPTETEVIVELKPPPKLFADSALTAGPGNCLGFRISRDPDTAIAERVKFAWNGFIGVQKELRLLEQQPGEETPYERLLSDAMIGDGALFAREMHLRPPGLWSIRS